MLSVLSSITAALCSVGAAVMFCKDAQATAAAVPVVTTAETLVVPGNALSLQATSGKAVVKGFLTLTVGTGTTAVTVRLYRGTTTAGTLIGSAIAQAGNFTAGSPAAFSVQATDVLSNVGGAQYCMSVQQTGASGNGSVTTAMIDTEILSG
jgi:hypothetical protein